MPPEAFTIPIAVARFVGGRGIVLDTHAKVKAAPKVKSSKQVSKVFTKI